ncbi:pseudouridine synthase [Millionella massiliensis]|uniref:pseudouridine synthase n=1 Tax=Millionella massiliensis TaxID=1871023 RepID=UPI0024B76EFA|nr:pseudouridine synthase [Millionella massiliensis]
MDNQDSNKKRPFGRDERSGRSFFRIRREGAIRSEENRRDAAEEANARPGYKKSHAPRVASDERRQDERPSHAGRRDERPAQGGKKRFDRGDERGSRREGYPQRFDKRDGERPAFAKRDRKFRTEEAAPVMPEEMRLNRFIAMSGVCSRREADQLIAAGEVTVNGVMVDQLGAKIHPGRDEVRLNGELLKGEKKVYILLNKPKGYVTTLEDPHADRTVIDLLKGECKERVYPVGRLDKNTTGVLLLTNDGNLTKELTHPSFSKKKIYHVFLDKPCTEEVLDQLVTGIELEDGPIYADEVSFVDGNPREVGVELHSGRNRIVRRMFEAVGYEVVKLDRVYFAGLTKMGLRRGFWRYLTPREVAALKSGAYE